MKFKLAYFNHLLRFNRTQYYRDLTYVNRDGLGLVIRDLNLFILKRYLKLSEISRHQLIWLLREVLKNGINGADSLIYNLLRQIAGGDVSPKNLWLAETVLDLLNENRLWLERHNILIATSVYTFLRLIADHVNLLYASLRKKEVNFCVTLLRERFSDCMVIGRDLIRLLQNVARIPEFEAIWKDILQNPTSLSPTFNGILTLMQTRTSRRFLQCRLTPDMERKITFLTSHVKFGQQKRFQEWFQRQYLSTPESQSLRCDLIRFICCVIHPTNEVLCSEIIPRWAVIGWILSSCTSTVATSNAKLSIFYDWLFFDPERDNIMNIEPAILVMHHSLRTHPVITVSLLDFLCRIMRHFSIPLAPLVRKGIYSALNFSLEKRVVSSLSALFETPKIDRELRLLVREYFPEYCSPIMLDSQPITAQGQTILPDNFSFNGSAQAIAAINGMKEMEILEQTNGNGASSTSNNTIVAITSMPVNDDLVADGQFSDDEDCEVVEKPIVFKQVKHSNGDRKRIRASKSFQLPSTDFNTLLCEFESGDIRNSLEVLRGEKQNEAKCELVVKFLQAVLQEDDLDIDALHNLSQCLAYVLRQDLTRPVFPKYGNDLEALEESIGSPLFVLFRDLVQTPEDDPSKEPILSILAGLVNYSKSVGYLLLYFIKVVMMGSSGSDAQDQKWSTYREFAKALNKDLCLALLDDLNRCVEEDVDLFCFIIPDVYSNFANVCVNNADILHLLISCLDAQQLQQLVCQIVQGNLVMFKKDSMLPLLNTSLEWETFEQFCFWQLISAHDISLDYILPVLPKLESGQHSEALLHILLLVKREEPSLELLKNVTSRETIRCRDDFSVSILKHWAQQDGEKLADLISAQLTKGTPAKKRRQGAYSTRVQLNNSAEQLLVHLDHLRQQCKDTLCKSFFLFFCFKVFIFF